MTEILKESIPYPENEDEYAYLTLPPDADLIKEKEEACYRQIKGAYENALIDEVTYRRLIFDKYEGKDYFKAMDHYYRVNEELMEAAKALLHERIQKGAAYIESITPDHPMYQKAVERYDQLIEEWRKIP